MNFRHRHSNRCCVIVRFPTPRSSSLAPNKKCKQIHVYCMYLLSCVPVLHFFCFNIQFFIWIEWRIYFNFDFSFWNILNKVFNGIHPVSSSVFIHLQNCVLFFTLRYILSFRVGGSLYVREVSICWQSPEQVLGARWQGGSCRLRWWTHSSNHK